MRAEKRINEKGEEEEEEEEGTRFVSIFSIAKKKGAFLSTITEVRVGCAQQICRLQALFALN